MNTRFNHRPDWPNQDRLFHALVRAGQLVGLVVALGVLVATVACPPAPAPPIIDAGDGATCATCTPDAPPPPPPGPPIVVDAGSTTVCEAACATLARIGCVEGTRAKCADAMQVINDSHLLTNADGGFTRCTDVAAVTTRAQAMTAGVGCTPIPDAAARP